MRGGRAPNAKGSAFERHICRQLSMWVSNFKQSDCLWRTPNSGGRERLSRLKKDSTDKAKHAGDITSTDPMGDLLVKLFIIECKAHRDLNWHHMIYGSIGKVRLWWDKLYQDSYELKRMPMLIAKQNFQKPIVVLDRNGRVFFKEAHPGTKLKAVAHFPPENMSVYRLSDLIMEVDFLKVRRLVRKDKSWIR